MISVTNEATRPSVSFVVLTPDKKKKQSRTQPLKSDLNKKAKNSW